MGRDVPAIAITRQDRRAYREKARTCLDVLERMLRESRFDGDSRRIGLEIEFNLVDAAGRAAMTNADVLASIDDPAWTSELGQFNFELDSVPAALAGRVFSWLESSLGATLAHAFERAEAAGSRIMMVGILPSLRRSDIGAHTTSANPRYKLLNDEMLAARGAGATGAVLELTPERGPLIRLAQPLPEPVAHGPLVERVLVDRLQAAQPSGPIVRLSLELDGRRPEAGAQLGLFTPQSAQADRLRWQLLGLTLRFGEGRLWRAAMDDPEASLPEGRVTWRPAAAPFVEPRLVDGERPLAENHGPLDDILQLADIPGPLAAQERVVDGRVDLLRLQTVFLAEHLDESVGQEADVVCTLA